MKITYLSHATILIETAGIKILTDPWLVGSAYTEQWYLFPTPIANYESYLQDIDYVLISHGHEDHLHLETLKKINKTATVFFPYTWFSGAKELFAKLGFTNFIEVSNEKKYTIAHDTTVTFIANNLDNMLVIKSGAITLVDINDSLPAAPKAVITYFCEKIKKLFPTIDYVFCSHAGASYYPNTIQCDWKDDIAIGQIRELFFVDNFCRIVESLSPTSAIPFGSDFILLDDNQRWINTVRYPRHELASYFNTYFPTSTTSILESYAGDVITDHQVTKNALYHTQCRNENIDVLINNCYAQEIEKKRNRPTISSTQWESLYELVSKHILQKAAIVPLDKRKELVFQVQITDATNTDYITIDLTADVPRCSSSKELYKNSKLLVKIRSAILQKSITREWGGDSIVIGYGCEIVVYEKNTIVQQLDNWAVLLLSQYPNTKSYVKKNPIRALKYLLNDDFKRKLFWNKLTKKQTDFAFFDPILKDADLWFNRTNCEICRKCNLPLLDTIASQQIHNP